MDRTQITLLLILAIMVLGSLPLARSSNRRDAVRGGLGAQVFHFIGVLAYIGVLPAALLGSILVGPLRFGLPLALGLLAVSLLALFIYAIFERPARAHLKPAEDRGWTAEDALRSGL
ncbi:MAG: hypothetical protein HZC41_18170 [Chloroflexi bacterium]|nr:hypothetical protein [Chloroflexota bacterium]